MSAAEELARMGVRMRSYAEGSHKTVCPKCSHTRKKKRDPCLSVTIDGDGWVVHCHHCNWSEGSKTHAEREARQDTGRPRARSGNSRAVWRRKFNRSWV